MTSTSERVLSSVTQTISHFVCQKNGDWERLSLNLYMPSQIDDHHEAAEAEIARMQTVLDFLTTQIYNALCIPANDCLRRLCIVLRPVTTTRLLFSVRFCSKKHASCDRHCQLQVHFTLATDCHAPKQSQRTMVPIVI